MLFSHKIHSVDKCYNLDGHQKHDEWKEPGTKVTYDITHSYDTSKIGKSTETETEEWLPGNGGCGEWGMVT
jgi:hypothetical protein